VSEDGNREERCWKDGLLDGPATVEGVNGDRLEFNYKQGVREGSAIYKFADGSEEVSLYKGGEQTGPAKFTWPNGAVREGSKVKGAWDGECFYTFSEGPRAGKRDLEKWKDGELVSSVKHHGDGKQFVVQDWEDLEQLEELTKNPTPGV